MFGNPWKRTAKAACTNCTMFLSVSLCVLLHRLTREEIGPGGSNFIQILHFNIYGRDSVLL